MGLSLNSDIPLSVPEKQQDPDFLKFNPHLLGKEKENKKGKKSEWRVLNYLSSHHELLRRQVAKPLNTLSFICSCFSQTIWISHWISATGIFSFYLLYFTSYAIHGKVTVGYFMIRHDVLSIPKPRDGTYRRQCKNTVTPLWYLETYLSLHSLRTVRPEGASGHCSSLLSENDLNSGKTNSYSPLPVLPKFHITLL